MILATDFAKYTIWHEQNHRNALLKSGHLNGETLGCHSRTQLLESSFHFSHTKESEMSVRNI